MTDKYIMREGYYAIMLQNYIELEKHTVCIAEIKKDLIKKDTKYISKNINEILRLSREVEKYLELYNKNK